MARGAECRKDPGARGETGIVEDLPQPFMEKVSRSPVGKWRTKGPKPPTLPREGRPSRVRAREAGETAAGGMSGSRAEQPPWRSFKGKAMNQGVGGSSIIPQSPREQLWKSFGTAVTGWAPRPLFTDTTAG